MLADERFTPPNNSTNWLPSSAPGTVLTPLTDDQNTTRDLVNTSGTMQNHIEYNSFGRVTAESAGTVDYLFGYTGFVRDEETKLDVSNTRLYSSELNRWMNQDPIGFNGGDANLNRFVGNGPTNAIDPSGFLEWEVGPWQFWIRTLLEYSLYKEGENGNTIEHVDDRWARAVGNQPEVAKLTSRTLDAEIRKAIAKGTVAGQHRTDVPFQGKFNFTLMNGDGIAFWLGTGKVSYRGSVTVWWKETSEGMCVDVASAKSTWKWKDVIDANPGNLDKFIAANGGYAGMMDKLTDSPFWFGWETVLVGGVAALEDVVDAIHDKTLSGGFPVLYQWEVSKRYLPDDE